MADLSSVIEHRKSVHNIQYFNAKTRFKHIDLEPDVYDPNCYCQTCDTKYTTKIRYRIHLRVVHHMVLTPLKSDSKNDSAVQKETLYCNPCKRQFDGRSYYRQHLKRVHKIELKVLADKEHIIKRPDILPKWNNQKNYCRSCEITFINKRVFLLHCYLKHDVKPPKTISPDRYDPNFHCKICNITYKSDKSYAYHCRTVHPDSTITADSRKYERINYCKICKKTFQMGFYYHRHMHDVHEITDVCNSGVKPDVNDPNFYCSACDITLRSKTAFKKHLLMVHFLGRLGLEKLSLQQQPQDVNNQLFHCRICKRTYPSKTLYRHHLGINRKTRPTRLSSTCSSYTSKLLPDPLDPNYYCCICDKTIISLGYFRQHCKITHRMKLDPIVKKVANSEAVIDINSPDFYCAKCDKYFAAKTSFTNHLKVLHSVELIRKRFVYPNAKINVFDPNRYCAKCDKYLATKSGFKYHLTHFHKLVIPSA